MNSEDLIKANCGKILKGPDGKIYYLGEDVLPLIEDTSSTNSLNQKDCIEGNLLNIKYTTLSPLSRILGSAFMAVLVAEPISDLFI